MAKTKTPLAAILKIDKMEYICLLL